jgi:hypothetical protein
MQCHKPVRRANANGRHPRWSSRLAHTNACMLTDDEQRFAVPHQGPNEQLRSVHEVSVQPEPAQRSQCVISSPKPVDTRVQVKTIDPERPVVLHVLKQGPQNPSAANSTIKTAARTYLSAVKTTFDYARFS